MLQAESPAEALTAAAVGCVPAVCMLCLRAEADPDTCGDKWQKQGICAHVFCLVSSPLLFHSILPPSFSQRQRSSGILGFLPRDIQHAVRRALRAGALFFQCPLCRNDEAFPVEMFVMGIRVPFRQPTWEDNDAFAELGERHGRCNARKCLHPRGREEADEEGPWELLLCSSCAAEGTHRRCAGLRKKTLTWECDSCAGLGTGMSTDQQQCPACSIGAVAGTFIAGQQPWHRQ
uniref:PHF7/G2E3-like PHD zinc finger domain-containing protein n=1 Tax=Malurus cyaneus samueli TaxID=2593467 RepID=A0A8C5UB98_9PASS